MKRNSAFNLRLIAVIASVVLTSACQGTGLPELSRNGALPGAPASYQNELLDAYIVEVGNAEITALIDSRDSFLVYIGNDYCHSCLAFRPALIEYIVNYETLVYHYDNINNSAQYPALYELYPDYFPENPPTPSLYFFKDGALRTRQDGAQRMFVYDTLAPMMRGYADLLEVYALHTIASLDSALSAHDGVYFFYDRDEESAVDFYHETIIPTVKTETGVLWQVEVSLNEELKADVSSRGGHFGPGSRLVNIASGMATASIVLGTATLATLSEWLATYL